MSDADELSKGHQAGAVRAMFARVIPLIALAQLAGAVLWAIRLSFSEGDGIGLGTVVFAPVAFMVSWLCLLPGAVGAVLLVLVFLPFRSEIAGGVSRHMDAILIAGCLTLSLALQFWPFDGALVVPSFWTSESGVVLGSVVLFCVLYALCVFAVGRTSGPMRSGASSGTPANEG